MNSLLPGFYYINNEHYYNKTDNLFIDQHTFLGDRGRKERKKEEEEEEGKKGNKHPNTPTNKQTNKQPNFSLGGIHRK